VGSQQYSDNTEGQSSTGLASAHLEQNIEGLLYAATYRAEREAHGEPKTVLSVVISSVRNSYPQMTRHSVAC
jgi:hypothetical protein